MSLVEEQLISKRCDNSKQAALDKIKLSLQPRVSQVSITQTILEDLVISRSEL